MKISGKAFVEKALKPNLSSKYQKSYIPKSIKDIAHKAGVNLDHPETSLTPQKARGVLREMKKAGVLKSEAGWSGFDRELANAAKPPGPSQAVLKGRIALSRAERQKEFEKKEAITQALSRDAREKASASGAPKPSAVRTQAPVVGGGVIGKAAQDASRGGGAQGSFSGADRIEHAEIPAKPEPPSQKTKEAIDPFGED